MSAPIFVEIENIALAAAGKKSPGKLTASQTVTIKLWGDDYKGTVVLTYTAVSDGPAPDPTVTPDKETVLLDPDDNAANPVRRYVSIEGDPQTGVFTVEANGDNGEFDSDSAVYNL